MNKNILLVGAITILAIVAVFAFANPDENPGTDSANPSESGREHANDNAAFNRGAGELWDSCSSDADCDSGLVCSSGQCLKPSDAPCTDSSECANGVCDGITNTCD